MNKKIDNDYTESIKLALQYVNDLRRDYFLICLETHEDNIDIVEKWVSEKREKDFNEGMKFLQTLIFSYLNYQITKGEKYGNEGNV